MSVGLLAICLLYRFYIVGHLSAWFTFSVYVVRFLVVVSFSTLAGNGLGLGEGGDFNTKFDVENQTLINHKCVCGELNRHFCQTRVVRSLLYVKFIDININLSPFRGSSFYPQNVLQFLNH